MSTIIPAALSYDFNKTCGALRLIMSLRSWWCRLPPCGAPWLRQDLRSCKTYDVPAELRWFLLCATSCRCGFDYEHMQYYCFDGIRYCNTFCWSRLQGKAAKTNARRLPRSPLLGSSIPLHRFLVFMLSICGSCFVFFRVLSIISIFNYYLFF